MEINREKTAEGHNSEIDYRQAIRVDTFPSNEVPIYTWLDATLREISELIKAVVKSAQQRSAHLEFNAVTFDSYGNCKLCKIATISSTVPGPDDNRTLRSIGYQIGDYFDVAILTPKIRR